MAAPIMLIHGAWLTPSSWDRFRQFYERQGLAVSAPPWPGMDRPIDILRQRPARALARLGVKQLVDHYSALVAASPAPPVLIGHSFGGLIVQLLLERGLGAAGVAIAPVPPFGVAPHPRAAWTSLPVFIAWNGWNRVMTMSLRGFSTGFAQTLPPAERLYAHDKFIVPTPGRIFFQALLGIGNRLRWDNPARPPLLLIAGGRDRTVPAAMVESNYRRQLGAPSTTSYCKFAGRSHFLCNEAGWEQVAEAALAWALEHARGMP
ncbi:alpha/beta hydrolase [Allosphingosinicella deserti]|uniref:Alpha/beta hydrolase n=1 Tax=Allosphingosinicella deserti TaxID=2116704 RepID=A0A2P7QRP5_9SPHN|nr:alpha/beta fold hydrolase [Sphingomonas deserti]PSJ40648.1 alpha/beta hydrolase [Sphingomonas deserti]